MKHDNQFNISIRLMCQLVSMVENGAITKDHPLFEGRYEAMKRYTLNVKTDE